MEEAFCRFLCPLGAIYGFFNPVAILGIRRDDTKCNRCGACARMCKMDTRIVCDRECIKCGECRDICPQKAISSFPTFQKRPPTGRKGGTR